MSCKLPPAIQFLSTLPARGATFLGVFVKPQTDISIHAPRDGSDPSQQALRIGATYFYPRSPRGERPRQPARLKSAPPISIHAPREGSDYRKIILHARMVYFYPRSPRGERPRSLSTTHSL